MLEVYALAVGTLLSFLSHQALREGGVAGVVEGLAPLERRLPPPECLAERRDGRGCKWMRFACSRRAETVVMLF